MERERRESGPPLPPGPGGAWPVLVSVALVAFLLAGMFTLAALVEWLRPGGILDPVNLLLVGLAIFPLTVLVGLRIDPDGFARLRDGLTLGPARTSTTVFALLLGLAAVLPVAELDNLLQYLVPQDPEERRQLLRMMSFEGWASQLAKVFAIAVVTPIGEELIFRGILLRWLRRSYGRLPALLGSSVLFAVAHLSLRGLLPYVLLGLAFGWVVDRSRSVLPAIGAHAAYNAVPFLFPPELADVPGWTPAADAAIAHLPSLWVVGSSAACVVLLYLIWWSTLRRD
ncbi:MAG: CPBP family intramembrane metalloprotease [Deltaproteobacteria bacterium]|nr:CPBP family intramembrane metalloprotease [Deltaproteobacteria bacterium]